MVEDLEYQEFVVGLVSGYVLPGHLKNLLDCVCVCAYTCMCVYTYECMGVCACVCVQIYVMEYANIITI